MKQLKKWMMLLISLPLLGIISSCSSIKKIDKPICIEHSMIEGHCITVISGKKFIVNEDNKLEGKTWYEMRPYMIQVPISTWTALKEYIINECNITKRCLQNTDENLKNIDGLIPLN